MGKTIVDCSGVYPASSRASSLAMFVLQEALVFQGAFGALGCLWGVPEFRNPVCSLEMNQRHGWRKLMAADR